MDGDYANEALAHNAFTNTTTLLDRLESGLRDDKKKFEPTSRRRLQRAVKVAQYIQTKLNSADPELLAPQVLDAIGQPITQAANSAKQSIANPNDQNHINQLDNHLSSAIDAASRLPSTMLDLDETLAGEQLSQLHQAIQEIIEGLEESTGTLEAKILDEKSKSEEIAKKNVSALSEIEEILKQSREDFSQEQISRDEEFTKLKNQLNTAKSTLNDEGQALKSELQRDYDDLRATWVAQAEEQRSNLSERVNDEVDSLISTIEGHRAKASELVGIIGNTGQSGGYGKQANEERFAKRVWQFITVAALGALVGSAWWAASLLSDLVPIEVTGDPASSTGTTVEAADPPEMSASLLAVAFSGRLFLALAFGVLGGYAGRQAGEHRKNERFFRQMELELASLDPYLDQLGDTERNALRELLALRFFGSEHGESSGNDVKTGIDLQAILGKKAKDLSENQ